MAGKVSEVLPLRCDTIGDLDNGIARALIDAVGE